MKSNKVMLMTISACLMFWVTVLGLAVKNIEVPLSQNSVVVPELDIDTNADVQRVKYTVYNAVEGQTDATPLVTADQSNIDVRELAIGNLRWVAVSRDLLKEYSFGDTIVVTGCTQEVYNGEWVIHDVMNRRYRKTLDFLVPSKIKFGKGFAFIKKK